MKRRTVLRGLFGMIAGGATGAASGHYIYEIPREEDPENPRSETSDRYAQQFTRTTAGIAGAVTGLWAGLTWR